MSLTFTLVCDELRLKVWVGQGHHNEQGEPVMDTLYADETETMESLKKLLNQTRGKALRLIVDDYPESGSTYEYSIP